MTAGAGAGEGQGFPSAVRSILNWNMHVDGVGGSGFAAAGIQPEGSTDPVDQSFITRLPEIVAAAPSIVVIAGGRNDMYGSPEDVVPHIDRFYQSLRSELPEVRIVTITPWQWDTADDAGWSDEIDELNLALEAATTAVGGIYIDSRSALTPIVDGANLLSSDGWHPNAAGYSQIGADLARIFVASGLPRGPERWRETAFKSGEWTDFGDAVLLG